MNTVQSFINKVKYIPDRVDGLSTIEEKELLIELAKQFLETIENQESLITTGDSIKVLRLLLILCIV